MFNPVEKLRNSSCVVCWCKWGFNSFGGFGSWRPFRFPG